ncbi:MAG: hypothetical protein PHZ00_04200 [Candidatus Peribacteraceae bacterium]|nr:hypothetical protein [Candidatus Peribacteraceae bacterium]
MNRTCLQCRQVFEITKDDLSFYEKVSPVFNGKKELIPPPTLCPDCRTRQRFAWRNDRQLYHRKCDLTGKQIISIYAPERPWKVYEQSEWWGDRWDAKDFAQDFNFSLPFFEQFSTLLRNVPIPSRHVEQSENSEYGNFNWAVKNCYLLFASDNCEECYYSHMLFECTGCADCSFCKECSYCYQLLDSEKCYRCFYSQDLTQCSTVDFSFDCKNCRNCFGCAGLRNKEYHLFNEPLSKSAFEKRLKELTLTESAIAMAGTQAQELRKMHPRVFAHLLHCEDCTGDNLLQCKDCRHCFDGKLAQDCAYSQNIPTDAKDCHDQYGVGRGAELDYQGFCIAGQRTLFSFLIYPSGNNVLYSGCCGNCEDIFGCIGLKRQRFCILNKQYTKEEYEQMIPRIIEHMRKTPLRSFDGSFAGQEWGEFFPMDDSPFSYNETLAQEYFPRPKKEAIEEGLSWRDDQEQQNYLGPAVEIPETIHDTDDSICSKILRCDVTGKPYKIIPQELKFYRQMGIPIPRKCPDQRHKERLALRNPRKLWDRKCAKCQKQIATSYSPERQEIVYCEACYLASVY